MTYNYFADTTSWYFLSFLIGSILMTSTNGVLEWLNQKHIDLKERLAELYRIHPSMKKAFSKAKVLKACEYSREYSDLSDVESAISSPFGVMSLIVGLTPFLLRTFMDILPEGWSPVWSYALYTILTVLFSTAFSIPFSWYSTFGIESRYGFNRSSKVEFAADTLKSLLIGLPLSLGVMFLANYALTSFGRYTLREIAFLGLGIVVLGFLYEQFQINVLMKIFNRFEPLKDKRLARKIESLTKKCGYSKCKVQVMDGSRRSSHANAFVCGWGRKHKKIVLFDTLLKKYSHDEILSIVGHELGHAKLHHLEISRLISLLSLALSLTVTFLLIYNVDFYHAFGYRWITEENVLKYSYLGFTLSGTFMAAFSWISEPFLSSHSRKCEYAADAFSAKLLKKTEPSITSLIRLTSENLGNPFTHPLYELWNLDHPSLPNRLKALRKKSPERNSKK